MNIKYIDNLIVAKESLKVWLSNVEQLHFGNQMFAKANDLNRENTAFYTWYKGEGQTFTSFESFQILQLFYDEMYDKFLEYMELRDLPLKKSLFSNPKEKRQEELNVLFHDLKQNARKLVKSVDIFEEKLKTSPLFNEHENSIDLFEEKQKETDFSTEIVPEKKVLTFDEEDFFKVNQMEKPKEEFASNPFFELERKQESQLQTTPEANVPETNFDFEKRLQEEVLKIKKQLEAEMNLKIKQTEELLKEEVIQKETIKPEIPEIQETKPPVEVRKPRIVPQTNEVIDVAEEIRRILS